MSTCPICGEPVQAWERYPKAICPACVALACDEQGRRLRFSNEAFSGGFVAEVDAGGTWQRVDSDVCWVSGRRCVAGEHRFGGIVVQVADG